MQYLPPAGHAQKGGAGKYHGQIASGYDAKREQSPKWLLEQKIIEGMLSDLAPGTVVLDAPVGTGRFLPFYNRRGFRIIGMDISEDMLKLAYVKTNGVGDGDLVQGDVRDTNLPGKSVDVAVNCRISRWLSPQDCQKMLKEMQRVCRSRIVWTARIANHPHARSIELFQSALDGWKITHNEMGHEMDYRILQARPR